MISLVHPSQAGEDWKSLRFSEFLTTGLTTSLLSFPSSSARPCYTLTHTAGSATAQQSSQTAAGQRETRGSRPHLVGSPQVLELLLRSGVVRVPVGVELQRQFPVGLLDVLDGGAAGHPQDLVEVSPVGGGER